MTTNEPESEDDPIAKPEPAYPNSATWVARWLCPNLEREIKRTFEWCPQWWDHPEAVQRIEALWRARVDRIDDILTTEKRTTGGER